MVDVIYVVPVNLDCWEGVIGQHLKAESISRVAALVLGGALRMMVLTSLKVLDYVICHMTVGPIRKKCSRYRLT